VVYLQMDNIIGQYQAKAKLSVFSQAYSNSGRLPFLLFEGERGGGKTKLVREFRRSLKRPDGSTPPIIEINAASIKSMNIFAGQVYPVWRNEKAILFIDEVHELAETGAGRQILTYLLTILERDPNPVRRVTYNDREMGEMELLFDFSEMGIILATTDPQKLPEPLLDRLTEISLSKYNNDELFEIFKNNLPKAIAVIDTMKDAVSKTFRGHPRDAVAKAEELKDFLSANGKTFLTPDAWTKFKSDMGVYDFGLSPAEIRVLKTMYYSNGPLSLQALSASTGYSRSVIQQKYEKHLLASGLMDIDGKRVISQKGRDFMRQILTKA
jgi:Holliday junction resolvasome RuvABC ATP-dependent DNA helicase subunit